MNDATQPLSDNAAPEHEMQDVAEKKPNQLPTAPVKAKLFAHQQEGYERALRCFGYEDSAVEGAHKGGDAQC